MTEHDSSPGPGLQDLVRYGLTARVSALAPPHANPGRELGRVIRVARGVDTVRLVGQSVACERSHALYRAAQVASPPAVGDWVQVTTDEGGRAITVILPRWGTLARRDPAGRDREQVVVANVDVALLAFGLDRPLREGRVERGLALVHAGGADPVFVLTKADMGKHRERTTRLLDDLAPDVARVETSIATGQGLDELTALVAQKGTAALVGASGAGKSSLVNTLVGQDVQDVAEVRGADRKGRHTTTGRQLFPLPSGGVIIDTPGLRALGLWDNKGVEEAFPDIDQLAADCRFRDCAHRGEPGCAVAEAVARGDLDPLRLNRFLALHDELHALDRRRQERVWAQSDRSRPKGSRRHRPSPD